MFSFNDDNGCGDAPAGFTSGESCYCRRLPGVTVVLDAASSIQPSALPGQMTGILYLLRHAKAGWAAAGMRDFDRPLDERGRVEAEATGRAMRKAGYLPGRTICSNALRARETLESVAGQTDTGRVVFLDALYSEDATGYLDLIRQHSVDGSLLVVGHNPMTEDIAMALAPAGGDKALTLLHSGFPTCGLAVIRFEAGLATAALGKGYLEAFLTPAEG